MVTFDYQMQTILFTNVINIVCFANVIAMPSRGLAKANGTNIEVVRNKNLLKVFQ